MFPSGSGDPTVSKVVANRRVVGSEVGEWVVSVLKGLLYPFSLVSGSGIAFSIFQQVSPRLFCVVRIPRGLVFGV